MFGIWIVAMTMMMSATVVLEIYAWNIQLGNLTQVGCGVECQGTNGNLFHLN